MVFFSKDWLFLIIFFYKTDPLCLRIILIILAANDKVCVVASFNDLFTQFPGANIQFLFPNQVETFCQNYVTRKFQEDVYVLKYKRNYVGYLCRLGAATLSRLTGLSDNEIQLLGRWKLNCYQFYIKTQSN